MFNWFFGKVKQRTVLSDINWVEQQTEIYFEEPLELIQQLHKGIMSIAKEAKQKGKLIGEIYQGLGAIESAKIAANAEGVKALGAVQAERTRYQNLKSKLLEAAKN